MDNEIKQNDVSESLPSETVQNENTTSNNSQNTKPKGKSKKRFNIFNPFKNSYKQVKLDENKKEKTKMFGLLAILYSCICIGLCYPCVWLGVKGIIFAFTHNLGVFTYFLGLGNIFIGALSIGVTLIPYYFWFQGIYLVIMQLCPNRRFVSWLALIIWLASVAGIILLSAESFLVVTGLGHLFS